MPSLFAATGCAWLAATAAAQVDKVAETHEAARSTLENLAPSAWRIPIHELDADPLVGRYGIWAAGEGFKASFHDGFRFVAALGSAAPRSLPVGWRTDSISIGGRELASMQARPQGVRVSDWRFEYHHGADSVEAYDVREDGVEQSFVIARPAGPVDGELIVAGRWSTELTPLLEPAGSAHAMRFVDATGRAVVCCGHAIAIDADGHTSAVVTTLRGHATELRVPAEFVRTALWPITIDPLLTPTAIASLRGQPESTDVAFTSDASGATAMVTATVRVSAVDEDIYAWVTNWSGMTVHPVFADLSTTVSRRARVAFAGNRRLSERFAIAFERHATPFSGIRVWLHDANSTTPQSGSMLVVPQSVAGATDRAPDIGGMQEDTQALLVFTSDVTTTQANTAQTEVRRVFVDTHLRTIHGHGIVATTPATSVDREAPSVTTFASDAEDWIVCWQQRTTTPSGVWSIRAQRVSLTGAHGIDSTVASAPALSVSPHLVAPSVDGGIGRFCVAALRGNGSALGSGIVAQRFDWDSAAATPTTVWQVPLATSLILALSPPRTAFQIQTESQWGVAFVRAENSVEFAHVAWNGTLTHSATVHAGATSPACAIAFDRSRVSYLTCFEDRTGSGSVVTMRAWQLPQSLPQAYGVGCGSALLFAAIAYYGWDRWDTKLVFAPPSTPCALFLGTWADNLDLAALDMPNCRLLVGASPIVSIPMMTNSAGVAQMLLELSAPISIFMQWFYLDASANPLGVATSRGVRIDVQ